jgi:2-polyprenyl-6-methoxyphenol hydroxylase-like FAD-dependent oxidoreductase
MPGGQRDRPRASMLNACATISAPRHAVIVGGSLAGSCAGLALSRAGWQVTILERSSAELLGGTGISIDRALLTAVTGVDASTLPVVHVGFPATAWGLLRAVLSEELRQRPGVRVRTGQRVLEVRMEENGNEVVARTADGDLRADLLVGADGYSSVVRRFVAPARPHAAYSGYLLWRGLIDEEQVPGGFTERDIAFAEHSAAPARLVTFGVPGRDGDTRPGRRRGSFTWFDTSRSQLLRQSGKLSGDVVTGTLTGGDASSDTVTELRQLARRWPSPWRHAIDQALARRDFIGTPVAEYLPPQLARGSAALIGDAAHVVSPITGAGFHNGLLDVQALTSALQAAPPEHIRQALGHYEQRRLPPARRLVTQSQQWSRTYAQHARAVSRR